MINSKSTDPIDEVRRIKTEISKELCEARQKGTLLEKIKEYKSNLGKLGKVLKKAKQINL